MKSILLTYKTFILYFIVILFHSVGIVGLSTSAYHDYFLSLSFFNLLLSFIVLLLGRQHHSIKFYSFVLTCALYGMIVEWIGVHTHLLFGHYSYGENLGLKFYEVPLIIGINWCVLTISTSSIASFITKNVILHLLISCSLMVGIDLLIEPVAIKSDYWSWENQNIPTYNYICWFFVSIPIHLLYLKMKLSEQNKVSVCLFLVLVIFFLILNI